MLSDATLNRVSVSYARGYRDGCGGRDRSTPENGAASMMSDRADAPAIRPFADLDYSAGYAAGARDAAPPVRRPPTEAQIAETIAVRATSNRWRAQAGRPLLPEITREEMLRG